MYKLQIKGTSAGMNIQLNTLLIVKNEEEINGKSAGNSCCLIELGNALTQFPLHTRRSLGVSEHAVRYGLVVGDHAFKVFKKFQFSDQ